MRITTKRFAQPASRNLQVAESIFHTPVYLANLEGFHRLAEFERREQQIAQMGASAAAPAATTVTPTVSSTQNHRGVKRPRNPDWQSPPDDLICPISYQLFKEPVLAVDGVVYERRSIQTWFDTRGECCKSPCCGVEMQSQELIPDVVMEERVSAWLRGD